MCGYNGIFYSDVAYFRTQSSQGMGVGYAANDFGALYEFCFAGRNYFWNAYQCECVCRYTYDDYCGSDFSGMDWRFIAVAQKQENFADLCRYLKCF